MTELRSPRQHLGANRLLGEPTLSDSGPEPSTFLLPTGTVTFLLTDVAQSTATWEAAPESMAKAISRHYEILAEAVARNHGVRPTEQGEGDSIVAAFSRGADAVAAALDAQLALANEPWPAGAELLSPDGAAHRRRPTARCVQLLRADGHSDCSPPISGTRWSGDRLSRHD